MARLSSTAASLLTLVLWSWLGELSFFANAYCVEMNRLVSGKPSPKVLFRSGMEVSYVHGGVSRSPNKLSIGFYIQEDDREVAVVYVKEDVENNIDRVTVNFMNVIWGPSEVKVDHTKRFKLGIQRKLNIFYLGGFCNVTFWNEDRQPERTWYRWGASTLGLGNLTIYAKIPNNRKHSSVVYWECPSNEPEDGVLCKNASLPFQILVMTLIVVGGIPLVLMYIDFMKCLRYQELIRQMDEEDDNLTDYTTDDDVDGDENMDEGVRQR